MSQLSLDSDLSLGGMSGIGDSPLFEQTLPSPPVAASVEKEKQKIAELKVIHGLICWNLLLIYSLLVLSKKQIRLLKKKTTCLEDDIRDGAIANHRIAIEQSAAKPVQKRQSKPAPKPNKPSPKPAKKKEAEKPSAESSMEGATDIVELIGHRVSKKKGLLKVKFDNDFVDWCDVKHVYDDKPKMVERYIEEYKLYVKLPWKRYSK